MASATDFSDAVTSSKNKHCWYCSYLTAACQTSCTSRNRLETVSVLNVWYTSAYDESGLVEVS